MKSRENRLIGPGENDYGREEREPDSNQSYTADKMIQGKHEILVVWNGRNQESMGRVVNNGYTTVVYLDEPYPCNPTKEEILIDNIVNSSLQKIHDEKVSKDHVLHHLKQIKARMGKEFKKGYSEPHRQGILRCMDIIGKKIAKINKQ